MKEAGAGVKERALDRAGTDSPRLSPRDHSKSALTLALGSCLPRQKSIWFQGEEQHPNPPDGWGEGKSLSSWSGIAPWLYLTTRVPCSSHRPSSYHPRKEKETLTQDQETDA